MTHPSCGKEPSMWRCLPISLLLVCGLTACTSPSVSVVLVPNDRLLEPVYDAQGKMVPGRSSIADGYLREIEQDLEACSVRMER